MVTSWRRVGVAAGNAKRGGALALVCLSLVLSSCTTVGREFPDSRVADIRVGKTTQAEIRNMFGSPWRVGVDNGQRTWTYGMYRYQLFGQTDTKDLVVRFDANGVVASYSFNTTEQRE